MVVSKGIFGEVNFIFKGCDFIDVDNTVIGSFMS